MQPRCKGRAWTQQEQWISSRSWQRHGRNESKVVGQKGDSRQAAGTFSKRKQAKCQECWEHRLSVSKMRLRAQTTWKHGGRNSGGMVPPWTSTSTKVFAMMSAMFNKVLKGKASVQRTYVAPGPFSTKLSSASR